MLLPDLVNKDEYILHSVYWKIGANCDTKEHQAVFESVMFTWVSGRQKGIRCNRYHIYYELRVTLYYAE